MLDKHVDSSFSDVLQANANLIAAAPDLLAACKAALEKITGTGQDGTLGHHPDNPVPAQLRAAIAKATDGNAECPT